MSTANGRFDVAPEAATAPEGARAPGGASATARLVRVGAGMSGLGATSQTLRAGDVSVEHAAIVDLATGWSTSRPCSTPSPARSCWPRWPPTPPARRTRTASAPPAKRRADALGDIIAVALASPARADTGEEKPTGAVTVSYETLLRRLAEQHNQQPPPTPGEPAPATASQPAGRQAHPGRAGLTQRRRTGTMTRRVRTGKVRDR